MSCVVITVIVAAAVVCGLPTTHAGFRIIGGQNSTIEQHPYQVAIEIEGETLLCGGAILSSKIILTAAHPFCVHCANQDYQEENFLVRVGSTYRERGGQLYSFNLEQLTLHPNYGEEHKFDYDVAIISLNEEIKFSISAAPIPLITMSEDIEDGTNLIVTGYGYSSFNGQIPNQLQVGRMIKRNRKDCSSFGIITDRMLCVGKGTPTPFHGDSGGPLINEKGQLVGVVSWGNEEPTETDPAVFTNLSHPKIYKFIDEYLLPLNI